MLQPGSKGWINKYFYLLDKNEIDTSFDRPAEMEEEKYIHLMLGNTGINFGFPSDLLFAKNIDANKWTPEEKLKLLLFESHLFIYKICAGEKPFDKVDFCQSLSDFYGKHHSSSIKKIFSFFLKEENHEKLENVLGHRVDIKMKLLDRQIWINSLSNVFVYLDVILYYEFLKKDNALTFSKYNELAKNALISITLSAHSDGSIQDYENAMFKIFLASANLPEADKAFIQNKFKNGANLVDFTPVVKTNWMFQQFILDLSILTVYLKIQTSIKEIKYLTELGDFLSISDDSLNESMIIIEKFVLQNNDKVSFLQSNSSYEIMFDNISKHWLKILGRNKDKLATELKQSKQLISLIKKSTKKELSKEEKEIVKAQFLDIVKTMPSLAIFMLPGGTLLLPLVLKIIPDLIPSAFRDNEIKE